MNLLSARENGEIVDLPGFFPLARSGTALKEPLPSEIMPMPEGGHLYFFPDRFPLAKKRGEIVRAKGLPVAAILPQGYTRTLLPAYGPEDAFPWLPYFGYTACFFQNGEIFVAAKATQSPCGDVPSGDLNDFKWEPESYPKKSLKKKIAVKMAQNPENRILSQLAFCASDYHCYTAANIFFERWEGALPVSPSCNAFCRGCISKAIDNGPPSPQERLSFVPDLSECVSIVRNHFSRAVEPVISFGQGCEGEPSLQADLIEKIIISTRKDFPLGQFNMNTNGSKPKSMERLFKMGLDSIRVSMNSVQESWYNAYYRPKNYSFRDVCETIRMAKSYGVFVSINLLCFPGITDHTREIDAFCKFLSELKPDLIQLRNLNIDPWCYLRECIKEEVTGTCMVRWISLLREEFPEIKIGSSTPYILTQPGRPVSEESRKFS